MPYPIVESNLGRTLVILASSFASMLIPIKVLAIAVFAFITIDFAVGFVVGLRVRKEGFVSHKAYRTVWKLLGAELCVLLAYVLDIYVLDFLPDLFLANIFTGIICGVDLWSILANFAILSNHRMFRLIKKWGKSEIERKLGAKLAGELDDEPDENPTSHEV